MEFSEDDLCVMEAALDSLVTNWDASQEEIDLLNRITAYLDEQ